MIWDSEQVLPSQQRLLYGGKQLEDGKDLGDYSVLGESTVYLVLRLCGGGIWPAPGSAQGYGCVDTSEKCVDDGMSAIKWGAVSKLRMERQRRVVGGADVRHCLAEEHAARQTVELKLQLAQTALKLERAERERERAQLAQREEEVSVHLKAAQDVLCNTESMLRLEQREQAEQVMDLQRKLLDESTAKSAIKSSVVNLRNFK